MRKRRLLSISLLTLTIALVAAHGAYWVWARSFFRATITRWVAEQNDAGIAISYQSLKITGYPFSLRANLPQLRVLWPDGSQWDGQRVYVSGPIWNPHKANIELAGPQSLYMPTTLGTYTLAAAGGDADVALTYGGGFRSGVLRLHNTALTGHGLDHAIVTSDVTLSAAIPKADPADPNDHSPDSPTTLTAGISLVDIGPVDVPGAPSERIERLVANAELHGAVPQQPSAKDLERWSQGGGTVELTRLLLDWGPLSADAKGTIAFDTAMQPQAALTARLTGVRETVDALAQGGVISPGQASGIFAATLFLGKPDASGAVTVPLTLQDRWFSVGPARLFRLPPIDLK
jgi:hypothetical protein